MDLAFGIEEEFFVVSRRTQEIAPHAHRRFVARALELADGGVSPELLQSQIETTTPICRDSAEARHHLRRLRAALAEAGRENGLAVIAAGTHPTADWTEQVQTPKRRYDSVTEELQILAPRGLACGLHVHVGLPDDATRIDVMRRMIPFLPVPLALSCSSPFWRGMKTGFASYRLTAANEMPRSGTPPLFADWAEYQAFADTLQQANIIKDPSYIWWNIRPSHAYPTLEMRIPDACTNVEDALAIAALYRCLVRALLADETINADLRPADMALADECRWNAQRFGLQAELIDPLRPGEWHDAATVARGLVDWLAPHAVALGCDAELAHVDVILARGTSADRQLAIHDMALDQGASNADAMDRVQAWLQAETLAGVH